AYAAAHRDLGVLLDLYLDDPAAALPEFERYKALSGEDKPVSAWIAELRTRTGAKAAPTADAAAPPGPAGSDSSSVAQGASAGTPASTPAAQAAPAAPAAPETSDAPSPVAAEHHGGAQ
ncbi:MAG: hypothetical protein ACRDQZ_26425, partial [Mycobacteriales bacterium]